MGSGYTGPCTDIVYTIPWPRSTNRDYLSHDLGACTLRVPVEVLLG